MRTETSRTIKIEFAEDIISLDEALDEALSELAKVIAAEMYREEVQSKQEVKA